MLTPLRAGAAFAIVGLFFIAGCKGCDSPSRPQEKTSGATPTPSNDSRPSVPDPVRVLRQSPVRESASATITQAGGSVRLKDGSGVIIPVGATSGPVEVAIRALTVPPLPGCEQVVLDITATTGGKALEKFDKPVEIRIPLPDKATPQNADDFVAGILDEKSGSIDVLPATIDVSSGKPQLVVQSPHFCLFIFKWLGNWWDPPPASAGPLDVPIYKQGQSDYCWATNLQILCKTHGPYLGNEAIYNIIGEAGLDYVGNFGTAWRPSIGRVVADRLGVYPERHFWDFGLLTVTTSTPLLGPMKRYIRRELGKNGRPVYLGVSWRKHAYVIIGYDDKGNFYVHDPQDVPTNIAPKDMGMGYYLVSEKDLAIDWIVPGSACSTLVIPKDLNPSRVLVSINPTNKSLYFQGTATNCIQFRWDYTRKEGYSFFNAADPGANPIGDRVEVIGRDMTTLFIGDPNDPATGIEVINASRSAGAVVNVEVHIRSPFDTEGPRVRQSADNINIPPRGRKRVRLQIPVADMVDPRWKGEPQPCKVALMLVERGGPLVQTLDRCFLEFKIESDDPKKPRLVLKTYEESDSFTTLRYTYYDAGVPGLPPDAQPNSMPAFFPIMAGANVVLHGTLTYTSKKSGSVTSTQTWDYGRPTGTWETFDAGGKREGTKAFSGGRLTRSEKYRNDVLIEEIDYQVSGDTASGTLTQWAGDKLLLLRANFTGAKWNAGTSNWDGYHYHGDFEKNEAHSVGKYNNGKPFIYASEKGRFENGKKVGQWVSEFHHDPRDPALLTARSELTYENGVYTRMVETDYFPSKGMKRVRTTQTNANGSSTQNDREFDETGKVIEEWNIATDPAGKQTRTRVR